MTSKPPKITEADIEQMTTEKSFKRGRSYYLSGALFDPVRQGSEIRGYCEGSSYEPYRVSAELGSTGVVNCHCTCPYDWGGICKHLVALLLTWVYKSDTFQAIAPLDEMLTERSQEELILIIKQMLKREPDLMRLLELPLQPDRNTPLDLEAFRRQINYAVRQNDYDDYYSSRTVAKELETVVEMADQFQEGGDWPNAGNLYALMLAEIVPQYEELYDNDGDVAIILQNCAEGLQHCFDGASSLDESTRRHWLNVLLEAEFKDIQMGGIDLAYPAADVLVARANETEWAWIEARIQKAIVSFNNPYSDWGKEALIGILAQRLELTGQTDKMNDLILETGTPRQRVFLLVERERFDEALEIARTHFAPYPGLVIEFANALVAAGADETAINFMTSLPSSRKEISYLDWLAEQAQKKGKLADALGWWRKSLSQNPTFQTYQKIRDIAQQMDQWEPTRLTLLDELAEQALWHILIDIFLDEHDVGSALDLLPKVKGWFSRDYGLRVARAAEKSYPGAAVQIYSQRIDELIEARGRDNYRDAAQYLKRVRQIYKDEQKLSIWQDYIGVIRQENRHLRALQDELNKAKL